GDTVGLSFGLGFGINERSSYSLGYSHKHVFDSQINGTKIQGSTLDIGQLLVGYSFKYSKRTTFNLSLGVGTTTDSQDVTLNFRMPMTFGLFDS
ncbi:MAG: transporter, partial [Methylobacter sp.]